MRTRDILVILLSWYQAFSRRYLPPSCRYWPSCSEYARQALERHGVARGLLLAAQRLLRRHPWGDFGHDPVPGTP